VKSEFNTVKQARPRKISPPPPSATQEQGLVPLSCPDCFGVLHFEREGPHGHLLYCCQVDHRYAVSSLLHAKEAQLERTLWSAALLLKQMTYAYEDLLSELKTAGPAERKRARQRANEAKKQWLAIRTMIEATDVAE
jgi:hypothetical protein